MKERLAVAWVLWLLGASCAAQTYYRVVAPDGSVTYTDAPSGPVLELERVRMPGHGYDSLNAQGEQRLQEMQAASGRLADERAAAAKADAGRRERLAGAEAELRASEAALGSARASKKSATPERIRMLEEQVGLARQRLREVRSGAE